MKTGYVVGGLSIAAVVAYFVVTGNKAKAANPKSTAGKTDSTAPSTSTGAGSSTAPAASTTQDSGGYSPPVDNGSYTPPIDNSWYSGAQSTGAPSYTPPVDNSIPDYSSGTPSAAPSSTYSAPASAPAATSDPNAIVPAEGTLIQYISQGAKLATTTVPATNVPDPTTITVRVQSGVFTPGQLVSITNHNYPSQYPVMSVQDVPLAQDPNGGSWIMVGTPYVDIGTTNSLGVPEDDTQGTYINVVAPAPGYSNADGSWEPIASKWRGVPHGGWHNANALSSLVNRGKAVIIKALGGNQEHTLNPKYVGKYRTFTPKEAQARKAIQVKATTSGLRQSALRQAISQNRTK